MKDCDDDENVGLSLYVWNNDVYVSRNDGKSQRGTQGSFAQQNPYHCCDTTNN